MLDAFDAAVDRAIDGARRVAMHHDISAPVLGGAFNPAPLATLARLESVQDETPDAIRRLAALGLFVAEDAVRLTERLRLSNEEARRLALIAGAIDTRPAPWDEAACALNLYRHGRTDSRDIALVLAAQPGAADWSRAFTVLRERAIPALPWRGADITSRGVAPGKIVGRIMTAAESAWIAAGFPDRQAAEPLLDAAIAGMTTRRQSV